MIAVIQRTAHASVTVCGVCAGQIKHGLMILLGVADSDTETDASLLAEKIVKLRIFNDENGKMNLSVTDVEGEILVISNFTLLANYKKGNRPDYMNSAPPDIASGLYDYFCDYIQRTFEKGKVERGIFGADMKVELLNDGPVTIVMDSNVLKK